MSIRTGITSCVLVTLLLAGCATSDDPREGGFFGGVQGLSSGAYADRVSTREARLTALRETQRELSNERTTLEQSRQEAKRTVSEERGRLARLQKDQSRLEREAGQLAANQGSQDQRITELQERLEALRKGMDRQKNALDALEGSGMSEAETDRRRRELLAQRKALRQEYDLLMSLTMDLAR